MVRARAWLVLLGCLLCQEACAPPPVTDEGETTAGTTDAARTDTRMCLDAGPLRCAVPPVAGLDVQACRALEACLTAAADSDPAIVEVIACEAALELSSSGTPRIALIEAALETTGPPSHGGYLLVSSGAGWCPAAELVTPSWDHGGGCELDVELTWGEAPGEATPFSVFVRRTCRTPLDAEELERGESDVALEECLEATYEAGADVLDKVSERAVPCPAP